MLLLFWRGAGSTPSAMPPAGSSTPARDRKTRRKFVIDGQVFNGTQEDAKRVLYALLDVHKPEAVKPKSKRLRRRLAQKLSIEVSSPPAQLDIPKYEALLYQARINDDAWLSQVLYEVWREAMQALEDDDEDVIWLM